MKVFRYLRSLLNSDQNSGKSQHVDTSVIKETVNTVSEAKMTESKELTERMLTISQAAKKNGITRQAIFFAIKMKRLNAKRENDTWLISERDLAEYSEHKYCRSKSRKQGELIYDKSKGFYSITEAAKFLGKNVNHIYYLVRMGRLKTHRQGGAIVIQDLELYKHAEFVNQRSHKNLKIG